MKTICSFLFILIVSESFQEHDIRKVVGSYSAGETDYWHWITLNSDFTFQEGESGCVQWEYRYSGKWNISGDTLTLQRITVTDVIEEYVNPIKKNTDPLPIPVSVHYLFLNDSIVPIRTHNDQFLSYNNLIKSEK